MTDCHADSADDKGRLSAPPVNVHDGGDGGDEHDDAHNTGCKKRNGVVRKTELAEDDGSVVKHSVNTSPSTQCQSRVHFLAVRVLLLEEHSKSGHDNSLEHGLALEQTADSHELQLGSVHSSQVL